MAPFRIRDRSNRSGRGTTEHNVLEGLPISQFRETEITIGPNSIDSRPLDKDGWPELPMPRDSHMLPSHTQQLLRAARSAKTIKQAAPVDEDSEVKEEEEESKVIPVGFTVKKYVKVARHLELPESEYLAKRRRGLPSLFPKGQEASGLRETKIKKLDADGNVTVYNVLVPKDQAVEGEVEETDATMETVPATAAPGTIVEGVGVVNAEGVFVANDVVQHTPPKKRPPPSKKKRSRGGIGRVRRRVAFTGQGGEQESSSNVAIDLLSTSGIVRDEGSVAPSDGGDTSMADACGEDDEGSGEEGSEDEEQDTERNSTPTTPLRLPSAPPTSVPIPDHSAVPKKAPADLVRTAGSLLPEHNESSQNPTGSEGPALSEAVPKMVETSIAHDFPRSPKWLVSHSSQNSFSQAQVQVPVPTPLPTTDAPALEPISDENGGNDTPAVQKESISVPEPEPKPIASESAISTVHTESIPAPVFAPEPVGLGELASIIKHETMAPEPVGLGELASIIKHETMAPEPPVLGEPAGTIKQETAAPGPVVWTEPVSTIKHETTPGLPAAPCSAAPFSAAPFSAAPFSAAPFSAAPFSVAPFSAAPFSAAPFSAAPFSAAPFSAAPFSAAPFSAAQFSVAPFSAAPCSAAPFSAAPFSAAPFSVAPFSAAPFSAAPFSAAPFSAAPFSAAPFPEADLLGCLERQLEKDSKDIAG